MHDDDISKALLGIYADVGYTNIDNIILNMDRLSLVETSPRTARRVALSYRWTFSDR